MSAPLVSVVIPVYNRKKLVVRAINSALSQTYRQIEVVVVDNCSTDGTYETLLTINDPRVKIFRNAENIGPVLNWRKGIEYARGEYVKILFSDDWMEPNAVERLVQPFFDETAIGFSYCSVVVDLGDGLQSTYYAQAGVQGTIRSDDFLWKHATDQGVPVSPCAALFRKRDLLKFFCADIPTRGTVNCNAYGAGNDAILYWRACENYDSYFYVDEPCIHFTSSRDGEPSITLSCFKENDISLCYRAAFLYFLETAGINSSLKKKIHTAVILNGYLSQNRLSILVKLFFEAISGRATLLDREVLVFMRDFTVRSVQRHLGIP